MRSSCWRRGTTPRPGQRSSSSSPRSPIPTVRPFRARSRSGSRCSTTTARCGPRSRSRSSSTSRCSGMAEQVDGRPVARRQPAVQGGGRARLPLARRGDGQALPRRRRRPGPAVGGRVERVRGHDGRGVRRRGRRVVHDRDAPGAEAARTCTCGFVPMVELLRYLEANGFTTYIASGGDRDFMRPFAEALYGIPPERVIGSALGLDFDESGEHPACCTSRRSSSSTTAPRSRCGSGAGSAAGRSSPVGNSNGDIQMMRFAQHRRRAGCACSSSTTTPSASSTTSTAPRTRWARRGSWLDRRVDARRLVARVRRHLSAPHIRIPRHPATNDVPRSKPCRTKRRSPTSW